MRLKTERAIDQEQLKIIQREETYWRKVLERLLALVRTLDSQNIAFRGTDEKLFWRNNGNFLKIVEFLALFDPVMEEQVRRATSDKSHVHYLGKDIQNELIFLLSTAVKNKIISDAQTLSIFPSFSTPHRMSVTPSK